MPDRKGKLIAGQEPCLDKLSNVTPRSAEQGLEALETHHIRAVVAANPNTPIYVLKQLAVDCIATIRQAVAENPRTPGEVLVRLARDEHADVRLAVAENTKTPPEVLAILAGDDDLDVRYGVAENPHMPEQILFQLTADENPYVRCRALKTLQMLAPEVQSRLKMRMETAVEATIPCMS